MWWPYVESLDVANPSGSLREKNLCVPQFHAPIVYVYQISELCDKFQVSPIKLIFIEIWYMAVPHMGLCERRRVRKAVTSKAPEGKIFIFMFLCYKTLSCKFYTRGERGLTLQGSYVYHRIPKPMVDIFIKMTGGVLFLERAETPSVV